MTPARRLVLRLAVPALPVLALAALVASGDEPSVFAARGGTLGGGAFDGARAVAVDAEGATWIAGSTDSADLPVVGALQDSLAGGRDAFVAKIAADGTTILFATYLGGADGDDEATGLALDASGRAVVAGRSTSTDFPVSGALQEANAGGADAFVARISADGSVLEYATYFGGSGDDGAVAVAVDAAGDAWIAGETDSADFPATAGGGVWEAPAAPVGFAACLASDGTTLRCSGPLGPDADNLPRAIALDLNGTVLVAGVATATDAPVPSPMRTFTGADADGFVARLSPATAEVLLVTYFGGAGDDAAAAIAADGFGSLWVAGSTESDDFPGPSGTAPGRSAGKDAFVAALSPEGATVLRAVLLGGTGDDGASALASPAR